METLFKNAVPAVAARTASTNTSKFVTLVKQADQMAIRPQGQGNTVASLVWNGFARMSVTRHPWRRATFKTLLLHLYSEGCFKVLRSSVYIDVLVNVSAFGQMMVRPIDDWKRPSFSPDEQLEDIIDHCFAVYTTPVFLITAFYGSSLSKMSWYVKLGKGASASELLGFPEHLTAKMVHIFKNTPRGFDVEQALVRSQALGFGSSESVAQTLAYTRLKEIEGNKMFWFGVIQFFAKAENKNLNDFRIIIDFLEFSVNRNRAFSIKGKTFGSLTREATAWFVYTQKMKANASKVMWYPSGIAGLNLTQNQDGRVVRFKTIELLSADDLYEEGTAMNHCVGDYVDSCAAGQAAIFSLVKVENERTKRLATIEIDPHTLEVEEVSANCNGELTNEAFSVLKTWCTRAGISGFWDDHTVNNYNQIVREGNPPGTIGDWSEGNKVLYWIIWFLVFQCIRACIF